MKVQRASLSVIQLAAQTSQASILLPKQLLYREDIGAPREGKPGRAFSAVDADVTPQNGPIGKYFR
jgi:hypothetical protein